MSIVSKLVKSAGKAVGKKLTTAAKGIAVGAATAFNPAAGAAVALALRSGKKAPAPPALPPPVLLAPVAPGAVPIAAPMPNDPLSGPVNIPMGAMPIERFADPSTDVIPAMPRAQFFAIMRQAYDKGVAREFGA